MRLFMIIFLIGTSFLGWSQNEKWTSHPDSSLFKRYTKKTISVNELMAYANGKRVLVYYYEHTNKNVNDFNAFVIAQPEVYSFIQENFYPIAVDLDIDVLDVSNKNVGRSKIYRDFLKEQTYYIEATPAFSVYNPQGQLRGSKSFLKTTKDTAESFMAFLQKRLK